VIRVGLAIHNCGLVRSKNTASVLLGQVMDMCLASLACFASLSFLSWLGHFPAVDAGRMFYMVCAAVLASGIARGAVGERSRFLPMLFMPVVIGGLIVPLVWCWQAGWSAKLGQVHDLAGAMSVQFVGGLCGILAAKAVGARMGKYNRDGSTSAIPGHSLPLSCQGFLLVFIGWFAYLAGLSGDQAGIVLRNLLLAASAGGAAGMVFSQVRFGKPDIHLTLGGLLGALVAMTAGVESLPAWGAVLAGAVAGVICPWCVLVMDVKLKVDDPSGGAAVHMVGGILALIFVGRICDGSCPMMGVAGQIGTQLLVLLVAGLIVLVVMGPALWVVGKVLRLRVSEVDEYDGLDLAEHDIGSYPDFQQNTIKSYHLREA
jgi:Amt family ammonium transporter